MKNFLRSIFRLDREVLRITIQYQHGPPVYITWQFRDRDHEDLALHLPRLGVTTHPETGEPDTIVGWTCFRVG